MYIHTSFRICLFFMFINFMSLNFSLYIFVVSEGLMKDWFLLNVSPSRNKVYHYYYFCIVNNYDSELFKVAYLTESAFIIAIFCCYRDVYGHFNSLIRKTMRITYESNF